MLTEILKNISELYYPNRTSELEQLDSYNNSPEHKNLCRVLVAFENKLRNENYFDEFIEDFKSVDSTMNFHDVTLFNSCDRSLNLQLTKLVGDHLHSICLNISVLVPYYTCYVLDAVIDESKTRWIQKPNKNEDLEQIYSEEISRINEIIKKRYKISKFPNELLTYKLPDISRGFIKFGDFTFFNAFFLDEYYTRL